ncbi:neuronal pentraxin-1 isoform X2 [Nematostella vectensis]|uniref:neuronal pentraxin-1 isoform X2 n=1 Tax=Nematostella vectensis TaxID=45351 RepID=UPI002076E9E8|nr:neuronal pentraxin-1 isoform X2 [Nematostella vectensis]
MWLLGIVIFIFLSGIASTTTAIPDECRQVEWQFSKHQKALTGHVIKTIDKPSESACETECYLEANCVSINFNELYLECQLNNATDESRAASLMDVPGWRYKPIMDQCVVNDCPVRKSFCQSGFGGLHSYRCFCSKCFSGARCEKGNFTVQFPRKLHEYHLRHPTKINLGSAFTAAAWLKTSALSGSWVQTIFSFAKHDSYNALFVYIMPASISIVMDNNERISDIPAPLMDDRWHHVTFTWIRGIWELYIDGVSKQNGRSLAESSTFSDVIAIFGQDQDSYGGGFTLNQCFVGSLSGVNVWSRVLNWEEIAKIFGGCNTMDGDAVQWGDLYPWDNMGEMEIDCPALCL